MTGQQREAVLARALAEVAALRQSHQRPTPELRRLLVRLSQRTRALLEEIGPSQ